jgi:hypothetical protein
MGSFAGIGLLYGVVLARRFKAPEVVEGQRVSIPTAIAGVLGIALGGTAAIGVALGWTEPYWVPEPILILTLYIIMGKRERIRQKAFATAVGVVAAVPVAIIGPPTWAISIIATVAFVLAFTQLKKRYWLYYALFTFALVLALSPPGHVGAEAAHRGSEILIGIGVLVVGLAILHTLADGSQRMNQSHCSQVRLPHNLSHNLPSGVPQLPGAGRYRPVTDRHFEATPGVPAVEYLGALPEPCLPAHKPIPEPPRSKRTRPHVGQQSVRYDHEPSADHRR